MIYIIFIFILVDVLRYIYYKLMSSKIHKYKASRDTSHKNITHFLNDMKHPDLFEKNILDLFFNKYSLEELSYYDVCDALYSLTGEDPRYIEDIKTLVKGFQVFQKKNNNRNVFNSRDYHSHICDKDMKLKTWFMPLPLVLITYFIDFLVKIYMKILGFKSHKTKNNVTIWYSDYNEKKGAPLVFFHASIGGLTFHISLLKYYHDNHNMIMPEIGGVSFMNTIHPPPTCDQIIEDVYDFYKTKYTDQKINLMGHSLGNNICCSFIDKYPELISMFFCVEGQIFFNRGLKFYTDFEKDVDDLTFDEMLSVPFLHRNLYVKYFMTKCMNMETCFLYEINQNIKIHMFHVESDDRILLKPQLEYLNKKNLPITYHIFKGNFFHGAFIFDNYVKNFIIKKISELYRTERTINELEKTLSIKASESNKRINDFVNTLNMNNTNSEKLNNTDTESYFY